MDFGSIVSADDVKDAMARVAGAVSIVTVGSGDERAGLTVTSMTSVSMAPPTLLFCINRRSSSWSVLQRSRVFAVNVLAARHRRLADQFAGRMGGGHAGRYAGAEWKTLATGAAVLADAIAAFDCEVEQTISKHSHEIIIGRVVATAAPRVDSPLLYWERSYEDIFRPRSPMPEAEGLACAYDF
jgi:flavin reductase (DIM6/NTAB) family NADH-FMN oxidoreductase RutF